MAILVWLLEMEKVLGGKETGSAVEICSSVLKYFRYKVLRMVTLKIGIFPFHRFPQNVANL